MEEHSLPDPALTERIRTLALVDGPLAEVPLFEQVTVHSWQLIVNEVCGLVQNLSLLLSCSFSFLIWSEQLAMVHDVE